MRFGLFRLARLAVSAFLVTAAAAGAQQLPPIEPPQQLPTAHPDAPTLRVTANEVLVPTLVEKRGGAIVYGLKPADFVLEDNGAEVLVPTLVEKRGGAIVYGLKPADFVLEDNGVPQKIRVQEEMD